MAHEIDVSTGKAAMAYAGQRPWHNLGTELQDGAGLAEWIQAAGLDWEALPADVAYTTSQGDTRKMPGRKVLHRSDTGAPLSVVSDRYIAFQPREVLGYFDQLAKQMGFKLKTAGALKGGARVWGMAESPEGFDMEGDVTSRNLLLTTTYDGTGATLATPTAVRVVCNNTLNMALCGATPISVSHRQQVTGDELSRKLHLVESWEKYQEMVRRLSDRFIPEPMPLLVQAYYNEDEVAAKTRLAGEDRGVKRFVDRLQATLANAPGADFHMGSAYALLNAVTYDVDHGRPARSDEQRMLSATGGEGARVKSRLMDLLAA